MSKQKTVLFGASVKKLGPLLQEASKRKHSVRAVVYDTSQTDGILQDLNVEYGHMNNKDKVADLVKGFNAIIALNEPVYHQPEDHLRAVKGIVEGAKKAGVTRVVIIGHPINYPIENTLEFYAVWKRILQIQREALKVLQSKVALEWFYIHSPSLEPSPVTGRLSLGNNLLVATPEGVSNFDKGDILREIFTMADVKVAAQNRESLLLSI